MFENTLWIVANVSPSQKAGRSTPVHCWVWIHFGN